MHRCLVLLNDDDWLVGLFVDWLSGWTESCCHHDGLARNTAYRRMVLHSGDSLRNFPPGTGRGVVWWACLCVCVFVREHISETARPVFARFPTWHRSATPRRTTSARAGCPAASDPRTASCSETRDETARRPGARCTANLIDNRRHSSVPWGHRLINWRLISSRLVTSRRYQR